MIIFLSDPIDIYIYIKRAESKQSISQCDILVKITADQILPTLLSVFFSVLMDDHLIFRSLKNTTSIVINSVFKGMIYCSHLL